MLCFSHAQGGGPVVRIVSLVVVVAGAAAAAAAGTAAAAVVVFAAFAVGCEVAAVVLSSLAVVADSRLAALSFAVAADESTVHLNLVVGRA